jgi:hypothetical protein
MASRKITETDDAYGALVGWTHTDLGGRMILTLQSTRVKGGDEVDEFRYFLTENQALLLGNYLCRVSNATMPKPPRKSIFRFGRRG